MKGNSVIFLLILALLLLPVPLSAKDDTVKIAINGTGLVPLIEITAPDIVSQFNVWTGPSVRVSDETVYVNPNNEAGAFIDWPKGPLAERSKGLQRFEMSFYSKCPQEHRSFVVIYEFDPLIEKGYMQLPSWENRREVLA